MAVRTPTWSGRSTKAPWCSMRSRCGPRRARGRAAWRRGKNLSTHAHLPARARAVRREIGTFQSLQHRAAHLFCEIELVRSVVLRTLQALDAQEPTASNLVCLAKAKGPTWLALPPTKQCR